MRPSSADVLTLALQGLTWTGGLGLLGYVIMKATSPDGDEFLKVRPPPAPVLTRLCTAAACRLPPRGWKNVVVSVHLDTAG